MTAIGAAAPAMAMLAVFALSAGGVHMVRKGEDRRKGWLMLICALILLGNVAIWTV